jgi:DNA-binding response OmpR family regulator
MAGETRRILVVEDEAQTRSVVEAYLEREGYWVTAVADGAAALEAFAAHSYEGVVLDLNLPKVPGE